MTVRMDGYHLIDEESGRLAQIRVLPPRTDAAIVLNGRDRPQWHSPRAVLGLGSLSPMSGWPDSGVLDRVHQ
ncbi:MAG: hypothetical protein ACPGVY_17550 [Mycobacterium sp.]